MKKHLLMVFRSVLINLVLLLSLGFVQTLMADSIDKVISHAIYQVKTVVLKKLSPGDVEEMINRARDKGATGYKVYQYGGGKMGWSMLDSKGKEVYVVIFSFSDRQSREGTYLGPLMSFRDAQDIHKLHIQVLSNYFKQLETDKYDIGDKCIALTELFKGTTGAGRTKITVKCY
jgi:hypothetical protein